MLFVASGIVISYMVNSERKQRLREERRQRNIQRRRGRYAVRIQLWNPYTGGFQTRVLFTSNSRQEAQEALARLSRPYWFLELVDRESSGKIDFDWRKEGF
jgi:muconolactone delta-isomerase